VLVASSPRAFHPILWRSATQLASFDAWIGIKDDTPFRAIYADEKLGWRALIKDLVVVDVDGGHSTMLQEPFVGAVAAALMPYINHKSREPPPPYLTFPT
jgi:thioesterase domain-containing protein